MNVLQLASMLHEQLNLAVAVGAAGVMGLSIAMVLGVERARFAIDWLILALAAVVLAGSVAGAILLAGSAGPSDILHLLYAAIVLAAIPVTRIIGGRAGSGSAASGAPPGRLGRLRHVHLAAWLIGGCLATLAALLRLAATG